MQNLALFLLLAITASTIFAFDGAVFAQEAQAPEEEVTEEVSEGTEGEVMQDETVEEDVLGDDADVVGDEMESTMMEEEENILSPRQQLMSGTDPHEIVCGADLQLVFKATNFHPACVKESSYQVLLQRGWVSDHDPSHEELSEMIAELPVPEETTEETPDDAVEEIEIEEAVDIEEDSAAGNGTEITPQSHTIELSESMEMGAN